MEFLYLLLAGVLLYWLSDQILERIEVARGERLQHRTIIFFTIILSLSLLIFWILRRVLAV